MLMQSLLCLFHVKFVYLYCLCCVHDNLNIYNAHFRDFFDISPKFQVRQVLKRNWNPMLQTWITVTNFLCVKYLQEKVTKKTQLLCLRHICRLIYMNRRTPCFSSRILYFFKECVTPNSNHPVSPPTPPSSYRLVWPSPAPLSLLSGLVSNSFTSSLLLLTTSHLPLTLGGWEVGIISK